MTKSIDKIIAGTCRRILPKYEYYAQTVLFNRLKRTLNGSVDNKYLFILSAPLCGSTMLNELLSTSANVSSNDEWGTREGQKLPTTREMMHNHNGRWAEDKTFDWQFIKTEWRKYWDVTKPVLLEKSPPNVIRAAEIEKVFHPSFFIVLLRNPYAQCEGLMRRKGNTPNEAAELVIKRMKFQKKNSQTLKNVLIIRYEDLCDSTQTVAENLADFIPEISGLALNAVFRSHNVYDKPMGIKNMNDVKINKLSLSDLDQINKVFCSEEGLLSSFNYTLLR